MPMKEYKALDSKVTVFAFTDDDALSQFAGCGINMIGKDVEMINHMTQKRETRTLKIKD